MNLNTGDALKTFCFKALALRDNMKDLREICSFPQCLRIDWTSHLRLFPPIALESVTSTTFLWVPVLAS